MNSFLRAVVTIPFLLFVGSRAIAQKDASPQKDAPTWYDITPGVDNPSMHLPYDSAFALKIHYKKKLDVYSVTVIEGNGRQLLSKYATTDRLRYVKFVWDDSLPNLNIRFDYNYNRTYVEKGLRSKTLTPQGPLKPGNKYTIVVLHDVIPQIFEPENENTAFSQFYDYCECELKNPGNTVPCMGVQKKAFDTYKNIKMLSEATGVTSLGFLSAQDAYDFFKKSIYQHYKTYDAEVVKANYGINTDFGKISFQSDIDAAKHCITTGFDFLRCEEYPYKKLYPKSVCSDSTCSISRTLKAFWLLSTSDLERVNKGFINLLQVLPAGPAVVDATKVTDRLNNIKKSLAAISELKSVLVDLNIILKGTAYPSLNNDIECLLNLVSKEIENLRLVKADLDSLKKQLDNFSTNVTQTSIHSFSGIDVYDEDAFIFDFQTRSAAYITPVFGYAMYGFQHNFTGFSPYLGFQVNFQPMNHHVPFRLIRNKTLWQRLAFTTAWSLTSVSSPGKREDFFSKSSLYTMLGFKLSHIFMLNVGTLWFKQINPDPFNSVNRIVCTPAIGLSVNLEIKTLLNGFTDLIPSL